MKTVKLLDFNLSNFLDRGAVDNYVSLIVHKKLEESSKGKWAMDNNFKVSFHTDCSTDFDTDTRVLVTAQIPNKLATEYYLRWD